MGATIRDAGPSAQHRRSVVGSIRLHVTRVRPCSPSMLAVADVSVQKTAILGGPP
jgi:hypothetical protein